MVRQRFAAFHKAFQEGNAEGLKDFVTGDEAKELLGPGAKEKLALAKGLTPSKVEAGKVTIKGEKATLEVKGTNSGQNMTGTIEMAKEDKKWKIMKVNWTMKLDLNVGSPVVVPEVAVGESFVKDRKQPPTPQLTLTGHEDKVTRIAFTPDGRFLVSTSYGDYTLRVWSIEEGIEKSKVKLENRPQCLAVTRDGTGVVTGDVYNNIQLRSLKDGILGESRTLIKGLGDQFAISPDEKMIAITGFQKPVVICSFPGGAEIKKLPGPEKERMMVFSPSGKLMVSAGDSNRITFWDTEKWKDNSYPVPKVDMNSSVTGLAFSRDGKLLATTHNETTISIWDVEARKEIHNYFLRDNPASAVCFSIDSNVFATAHSDKSIYVWDMKTDRHLAVLKQHKDVVSCLAVSPDGGTLASGGEDRAIIFWRSGVPAAVKPVAATAPPAVKLPELKTPEMTDLFGVKNYAKNPNATQGDKEWKTKGEITIEERGPGDPCFAIRRAGMLWQDFPIPPSEGKTILLVARVMPEKVGTDNLRGGLPHLNAYLMSAKEEGRIHHEMRRNETPTLVGEGQTDNLWSTAWGAAKIPADVGSVRLFLTETAALEGQPASAARFDDVGVFILNSEAEAVSFVGRYTEERAKVPVAASPPPSTAVPAPAPAAAEPSPAPAAPAASAIPQPIVSNLTTNLFRVSGMMGQPGTETATVNLNGNISVTVGEEFVFEHEGKKYTIKLKSVSDTEITLQCQDQLIVLPYSQ